MLSMNAQAAMITPFQGTGNFELTGILVSDTSLNQGMAFNNSDTSALLGYGGFDSFNLTVGENLHFWFTDASSAIVDLYGQIAELTTSITTLPNATFSFFGVDSITGQIFEASGSRTINNAGIVTSNSINVSGQFGTVPEPSVILLMLIGIAGFLFSKKTYTSDKVAGTLMTA